MAAEHYGAYIDFIWQTCRVGPLLHAADEAAARTWFEQVYFPQVDEVPVIAARIPGIGLSPADVLLPIWRAQGRVVARSAQEADTQLDAWRNQAKRDT